MKTFCMKMYPSQIERLHNQFQDIENILSTIDTRRILIRPQPEKWNIHDNIAHLVSYQPVFIERIHQILDQDEPAFNRYVADVDPEFEKCRSMNLISLIQQLHVDRKTINDWMNVLTETQLKRTGVHPKFGSLDLVQWTEFFLLHESHHIFTIFRLAYDMEFG